MVLSFNDINALQLSLLEKLKVGGEEITTRKLKTIEITSIFIRLENIAKRCTTLKNRKWNLPFALGELCWHLSGSNMLDFIKHYAREWENMSEDGCQITGSSYGYKIFSKDKGKSQWEKLVNLFKIDMFTRRGVIDLYESENALEYELKDIACSCSIQFLYRNNQLDATVYMRSNDIIWGLPNDIFFFTFLQELLAKQLNVKTGVYNHVVGSLHLYERHFKLADKILNSQEFLDFEMPAIDCIDEVEKFIHQEKNIRSGHLDSFAQINDTGLSLYWKYILDVLLVFEKNKNGLSFSVPNEVLQGNPYIFMIQHLLPKDNLFKSYA